MIIRQQAAAIQDFLNMQRAILIMGARQVGKSTLLHQMFDGQAGVMWLNGDDPDVRHLFEDITSTRLQALFADAKVVIIDEAQRIADVGLKLKLIVDNVPQVQLVATGSSSFELANKISEPLTGRKFEFKLYPLSFAEMVRHTSLLEEERMLPHRLIFGYYPEVVCSPGHEAVLLRELADSYLYKDILALDKIKKSGKLVLLLQQLALQIGSQVSYNELAQAIQADTKTVERYIDLLEKCFVIFRLPSYSRNIRNELKKSRKIYFFDNGIRNAVLGNFALPERRTPEEMGMLWENFAVSERIKRNTYARRDCTHWFWRTQQQQEIDLLEVQNGHIDAFEFKWNPQARSRSPQAFLNAYPGSSFMVVTPANLYEFLLEKH